MRDMSVKSDTVRIVAEAATAVAVCVGTLAVLLLPVISALPW